MKRWSGCVTLKTNYFEEMKRLCRFKILQTEAMKRFYHSNCAAEAIFYCPTMNSHRPRSQNTAKEQALIPEKESRRTWPRCHVSLEKSSKNHKPLEKWAKPNLLPDVTPQPANFCGEYFQRVCHVVSPDPPELFAIFSPTQDGQNRGEGGVI